MDGLYKLFDRFSEMIPAQLLPVIRLAAILVWVLLAGIVAILAWGQGSESAPQMGQELSLAEIKARQQREANLKKPQNVRIPDLNELIPERAPAPVQYESPRRENGESGRKGLLESPSNLLEARNPANDPVYQGEGLAPQDRGAGPVPGEASRGTAAPDLLPVGPRDYRPARDAGVGGVRDSSGGNLPGAQNQTTPLPMDSSAGNGAPVGLDGKALPRKEAQQAKVKQSEQSVAPQSAPGTQSSPARRASQTSGDLPLLD